MGFSIMPSRYLTPFFAGDVEATLAVSIHLLLKGLPAEQQAEYLHKLATGITAKVQIVV